MMLISRLPNTPLHLPLLRRRPIRFSSSSAAAATANPHHRPPPLPPSLFLRPLSHSATTSDLHRFLHWAESLVLSHFPTNSESTSNSPNASDLLRELRWLLQDATTLNHNPNPNSPLSTASAATVAMRVEMEELYGLWRGRVEERRPFQYVVGCEHWRDLVVVVREGVLIPRPETEAVVDMVEEVVAAAEGGGSGLWADLGTGSGALAVGIARVLGEGGKVLGTDVSSVAVEVARVNVQRYGLEDKVEIRQGSWFEPLQDVKGKLAGLVSNPPYIPSSHIGGLQAEVGKHEPRIALDGGEDGIDHLLHLCEGSASALKPGGFFAFETNGNEQSELIADLMNTKWRNYFRHVKTVLDFAGIKRFVIGFRC